MEDAKQLTAGSVSGATGRFVAFPFDTVKVRLQMSASPRPSSLSMMRSIMQNEGLSGFYRGLAAPIMGSSFENAIMFWGYAFSHRLYTTCFGPHVDKDAPSMTAIAFAGGLSGLVTPCVITPVEMVKCTLQVENTKPLHERRYKGVADAARQMVSAGGVRSLYHGLSATMLRESPGTAAWFVAYNTALRAMTPAGQTKKDLPTYKLMLAGGCGGVAYWAICFPADVVKTKMQLNPAKYRSMGFLRAFQSIYKTSGYSGLYAGVSITLLRAFPSNGVTFTAYEKVVALWDANLSGPSPLSSSAQYNTDA